MNQRPVKAEKAYEYRAVSLPLIVVLLIPLLQSSYMLIFAKAYVYVVVLILCLIVLALFYAVEVRADKTGASIYYGLGLISTHIEVGSIDSVKITKNKGIKGGLYNYKSMESAVVIMRDGKRHMVPVGNPRDFINVIGR